MSCTPLAAYALRCGYGLAAASSGTSDRTSRASDMHMASDRADHAHGHARRTRNGQRAAYPATRYIDPRPASRPIENRAVARRCRVRKSRKSVCLSPLASLT